MYVRNDDIYKICEDKHFASSFRDLFTNLLTSILQMATATRVEVRERQDKFELELKKVRENVKRTFVDLFKCLNRRENELLSELDKILESYHCYRTEVIQVTQQRKELERMKAYHEQELQTSSFKMISENTLREINKELNLMTKPTQPQMVRFVCNNNNKLISEIDKLGEYVESIRTDMRIDYKSKVHSVVSVCERGEEIDQLCAARGVTVDNTTGMIYVADTWNHCVKVFDDTGRYLSRIGDITGDGKMICPHSLAIYENRILISQGFYRPILNNGSSILNYQLDGSFISRIGRYGTADLEFGFPYGLTIDQTNGDIYVCDSSNERIQILSKHFKFISKFGEDSLSNPRDVKLSKDYIYVLDGSNPCVYLFDYDHILQKRQITVGEGMLVSDPYYFFIDDSDNLLISDYGSNSILIFNPLFEFIHKISVSNHPMGIVVDKQRKIIVVSESYNNCFQIF